jgi:hypothetical protein
MMRKDETFAQYYQTLADEAASLHIHGTFAFDQPQVKLDAWRRDPNQFPHFTAYLELSIYSLYDAERNQNSPLDPNWLADAEYLCFLVDVDAIVSSDGQFMKRAFNQLCNPGVNACLLPKSLWNFCDVRPFFRGYGHQSQ